jgi:hypothetical protein
MICALATSAYTVFPLVNFIAGGLKFSTLSDSRLQFWQPTAPQLGAFHWRHVLYLSCFSVMYFFTRGRQEAVRRSLNMPDRKTLWVILVLLLSLLGYFASLRAFLGWDPNLVYKGIVPNTVVRLPLFVRQITNYFGQWLFICKLALLVILVQLSPRLLSKIILALWLGAEVLVAALRLGARTQIVLLVMAAGLLCHRFWKPFKLRVVMPLGLLSLTGFLLFGAMRARIDRDSLSIRVLLSKANEFQSMLGTSYDLYRRVERDTVEVPRVLYVSELTMLVPQQICPFPKVDPSQWYRQVIGLREAGVGFCFGVVSQAILGLGWLELALRGILLGCILGKIHRWYVRHSARFLHTVFYLWLCLSVYNTFRASTLSLGPFLIYGIVPVFLLIKYLPEFLTFVSRRSGVMSKDLRGRGSPCAAFAED